MHSRRRVLRALAAGGIVALAGCGGGPGGSRDAGGSSPAASPTAAPSPTRRPGPAPSERVLGAAATAADGTRVSARRWTAFESVEYEHEDGAGTATVEPQRGRFVAYDFLVENTGDERLPAVSDTVFRLQLAGGTYRHRHSLDGVAFDRVVEPDTGPGIRPLAWYDGLAPGASVSLQLVFDVPHRPRFRHYLAWDHPTPVAGVEGVVFLWPGGG
jgi:hypothetical protein